MDKHAYMIIAHHQFNLLEMLVKLIDYEKNDIYIHIDKKVKNFDFDYFKSIPKYSNIYFTDRVSNTWGGYSNIKTELVLLKEAVKGNYSYYHLLSGVDMPIKKADEIYKFFEKNNGKEFIHFTTPEFIAKESTAERIGLYHVFHEFAGRKKNIFAFAEKCSLAIQRRLKINRLKNLKMKISCGANWFSITHKLAKYIISNEKLIKDIFKQSLCADEMFLQMLIENSEFKNNLYFPNEDSDYRSCMRHIDWKRGNPYVFKIDDFDELINSPCMFARKFDINTDRKICEKIFNYLKS